MTRESRPDPFVEEVFARNAGDQEILGHGR